jgi:hypothetical protein
MWYVKQLSMAVSTTWSLCKMDHSDLVKIPISNLVRKGPFTATAEDRYVDLFLAEKRESFLLSIIEDLVHQFSFPTNSPESFDSGGLSALADAMRALAASGKYRIVKETGRRVFVEKNTDRESVK